MSCPLFIRRLLQILILVCITLLYNEFIVYYIVLYQCHWPELENMDSTPSTKAMFIADTHLLGPIKGHWWDKLRREWQMQRSFQTSLQIHNPNLVFILGDLFDEGKWTSDEQFQEDVLRFRHMFRHSPDIQLVNVIGNHDVGFHYDITQHKLDRFVNVLNSSDSVKLYNHAGVTFVTVNSMAFEGDDCKMCRKAEDDLKLVSRKIQCAKLGWPAECSDIKDKFPYSTPILLQHYPMYRPSDSECNGIDGPPTNEKDALFKPKWDCLSKEASNKLMESIEPRLIISGHTHHFCLRTHDNGVDEWSVPSFSWRNKKTSSYLMVKLSSEAYAVGKCYMPSENTVYMVYASVIFLIVSYIVLVTIYSAIHAIKAYRTRCQKQL